MDGAQWCDNCGNTHGDVLCERCADHAAASAIKHRIEALIESNVYAGCEPPDWRSMMDAVLAICDEIGGLEE